ELLTRANTATKASVKAVALTVLDVRPSAQLYLWTVAVTPGQANRLKTVPWVISARRRGQMHGDGENLTFHDRERNETWSITLVNSRADKASPDEGMSRMTGG
ncbi:MAG TPA: hypothetical protein VKT80_05800, partial [Chloroflexota bacterium]|nr:hypothetical protein [Chloroflexota bacterium]